MNTNDKHQAGPTTDHAATVSEQHHGDLRKRAYLKRRAAYQMQAASAAPGQAGGMLPKRPGHG